MSTKFCLITLLLFCSIAANARETHPRRDVSSGMFSLGTRNTASFFSDDFSAGLGIGGQFRLQINDRFNTEWFADYITSKYGNYTLRNDYHIGWSVMFYPGKVVNFSRFFQPYILAGHCFDYAVIMARNDQTNQMDRWSMATQAGLGTHLNISPRFDCSLSAQYMLHFGSEIETILSSDAVVFEEHRHGLPHGHLLATVSFNYKFGDLW